MGRRLEVVRRPGVPKLTRSERRSWQLHRRLSTLLSRQTFEDWRPTIERNLDRLDDRVTGQPHERNLDRCRQLVDRGDLPGLHRVLTGLDRDSIEMREAPPCPVCSLTNSAVKYCTWRADAARSARARDPRPARSLSSRR
jgi:hypothetical protein